MNYINISAPLAILSFAWLGIGNSTANGQFTLIRHTIDGGGGTVSGGSFELNGTIGQPDAGSVMTGGNFSLLGGFWTGGAEDSILLGDVNQDGVVDLLDVAPFVDAVTSGTYIPEADVNQDGVVNLLDVAPFVDLLTG